MSDIIVIQPSVTQLTVTEDLTQVVVSSVGVQGPAGATGATGATGAKGDTGDQGPSGVVSVTAPITNSGTSSAANIGIDLSNIATKYASPWQVKYRSGYYYEAKIGADISLATFVQDRQYLYPLFIQETIVINRLEVNCTGANASTTWRIGIYNSDSDGIPSTVLLDAGTVSTTTTGSKQITVSQTINAGLYFIAGCWQGGSVSPTLRGYLNTSGDWTPVANTSPATGTNWTSYYVDGVTGAFGTVTAPDRTSSSIARTQFRIA